MSRITRIFLVLCFLLFAVPGALATTYHVPIDFDTIGEAIAAAASGDTIHVWPSDSPDGDYDEYNLDLETKELTIQSEQGAGSTIIDCGQNGRGFIIDGGQTRATMIKGFTISYARSPAGENGAGFYLYNVSPQIKECVITGCEAPNSTTKTRGGGLYASGGEPLVQGCEFDECKADGGGGMAFDSGIPDLIENEVHDCEAWAAG